MDFAPLVYDGHRVTIWTHFAGSGEVLSDPNVVQHPFIKGVIGLQVFLGWFNQAFYDVFKRRVF